MEPALTAFMSHCWAYSVSLGVKDANWRASGSAYSMPGSASQLRARAAVAAGENLSSSFTTHEPSPIWWETCTRSPRRPRRLDASGVASSAKCTIIWSVAVARLLGAAVGPAGGAWAGVAVADAEVIPTAAASNAPQMAVRASPRMTLPTFRSTRLDRGRPVPQLRVRMP
ncbi:MAG: hypothetical protein R2746_00755 [Acidimicrobiales bacterium]